MNVTFAVQVALTATDVPQVLVSAKSPVVAMLLIAAAAVPVFLIVTAWLALVVPSVWVANVRVDGVTVRLPAGGGGVGEPVGDGELVPPPPPLPPPSGNV